MRTRWIALVLALALTIAPTTAVASYQAEPAPDKAFEDIVTAFDEDRPEDAASTYRQAFAEKAEDGSWAAHVIETGLEQAKQAEPGSAAYAWASQVAKKGILAVSYDTIRQAAEEGDTDKAQAHFDVLAAKFDGEDQLADSKQAFDDVTEDGLDAALTTLDEEYRALITSKVYAETTETPELLDAGEPTTAAKEAGEALGYALSLDPHLDEEATQTLREELEGLGEHALAEEADATRAEADEILALLSEHALANAPEDKRDARQAYLDALAEGDIDQAEAIYEDSFADHASEYAPDVHDRIVESLAAVREAEGATLAEQHQVLEKSLLEVAWKVGFVELAEDEIPESLAYLSILVDKFDDPQDPGELGVALGHVAASQDAGNPHADTFREHATEAFLDKVHEEIDEVFINWDDEETAREKAIEGVLYYQPIHDEVAATLSEEDAEHLDAELRGLHNATVDRDREQADQEAEEARQVLRSFENAGQDVSELDQALTEIERTLNIITLEIEEYEDYTAEGNEEKAQEEIDESKAFIGKALSVFEDNRQALEETDAEAAQALEDDMTEIQQRLEDEEQITSIPDLVDQAVDRLSAFETVDPDRPTVDVRFGTPEPVSEGYLVPVQLVGVPGDAYAFQATVTYDEDELTIESVDVPADVGTHTTGEGEVTFNAASPDAGSEPVVAELLVVPGDPDTTPELSIDVEQLADDQGEAYQVGNVTGQQLDLASAESQAGQPVPVGPAVLAVSLLAATLIARRRA